MLNGRFWLAQLPHLLNTLAERWQVTLQAPFNLSYNYVAPVTLRADLLSDPIPPMLLHGDFHHENILTAQRRPWLALDPKGVIGDPAYEVGAYLYNPIVENIAAKNMVARRIDQFSEALAIDRQRLIKWGIVQAVLSAVWSYQDHDEALSPTLLIADQLTTLNT